MKKILITGLNSYVGKNFEKWLKNFPGMYSTTSISLRNDEWKEKSFHEYDVILHVAGIAHVSTNPDLKDLYYKVNRDLTIEVAEKAKSQGVKQFIFLSSIIVYGESSSGKRVIDRETIPTPSNFYGDSKLQAEEGIKSLADENFKIIILRPPMIYGKYSKGNYPKLAKAAKLLPIFPDINNERSMLHIDNLTEFIRLLIENKDSGTFFPQNPEYIKTSEMVKLVAEVHGKKIKLTKIFNKIIYFLISRLSLINKMFGNLVYDKNISNYKNNYQIRDLRDSIMLTEMNNKNKDLDLLIMSDNNLETVGGEQESTKIIIQGMKDLLSVGVIQPGVIKKPILGAEYFYLTSDTRIKHLVKHPYSFLKYIFTVKKFIDSKAPKIIHTQAQVSFFIIALLRKLRLISPNITLVHTERGLHTKYNKFIKRVFYFFIKKLDVLVTTTDFNMNNWKKAIQSKGMQLEYRVIENTAGKLFESFDSKLDKKDDEKLSIGFAGRYCDWKNWPLAVEICRNLEEHLGKNLSVKMAVGCLDEESEKQTKKMFTELNELFGNRFSGSINVDIEAMDRFYYDIDVFVLTSNFNTESFGRTLVEAMSRNTIVLTTNAGGSVEVVGNKHNVCSTSEEFIERILYFYNNKQVAANEKVKNLDRVKEKYSLNNNIQKHMEMYTELLKKEIQ